LAKGRMKVELLEIENNIGEMESVINSALKELSDYYIVDIKELGNFIAIMYLSEKKSLYTEEG
jgi:hypothetical protein